MSAAAAPTSTTNSHIYLFDISNWGRFPLPKPSSTGATLRFTNANEHLTVMPRINGLSTHYVRVEFDEHCSCIKVLRNEFLMCGSWVYGVLTPLPSPSLVAVDLTNLHGVTTVGNWFLAGNSGLTVLDLSPLENLTTVGNGFLSGCSGLTAVDFTSLKNVETVGETFMCDCNCTTTVDDTQRALMARLKTHAFTFEKLRFVRSLGSGGQGSVSQFLDTVTHTHVAVKSAPTCSNNTLRQEFDKLSIVDHPNVVRVHQFGEAVTLPHFPEPQDCIIMEHATVGPTSDLVVMRKDVGLLCRPEFDQWLDMALQTLRGLEVLHVHNIHHNDIKPRNVVMTTDANDKFVYKLVDLGFADDSSCGTDTSTLPHCVGTQCFIAPESVERNEYSRASDVYSWACTMGHVATGKMPKAHRQGCAKLGRGFTTSELLGSACTPLPVELAEKLIRCFSLDKNERPTVAQLLDTFGDYLR